jgi:hypothetical protein
MRGTEAVTARTGGTTSPAATGGCLCGAVRYEVRGPLRSVVACHCTQCRRTSGHYVCATRCREDDLVVVEGRGLSWFQSSAKARRGFCRACGGNLFWKPEEGGRVSIMAGTLDGQTGLVISRHIFVADKGDYYGIDDGKPQHPAR